MGKSSGGVRFKGTEGSDGGGNYTGTITGKESLGNIKNTELRREIQQGISKYESRLGVRQTTVQLANIPGANGVHVTDLNTGKSQAVYLSKSLYKNNTADVVAKQKQFGYNSSFSTKTNKPVQHTIVHELGHATWNDSLRSKGTIAASVPIKNEYRKFLKDYAKGKAKGFGKYSTTNVNEFWAEATAKAVLGASDKYTRFVKSTIKKYKL